MRYGSVCSGIEAATVAWHPLGWEPAFFSEIEKFPRAVLDHHYHDVPLHGDFTTIGADQYGSIDLLVGGTPCQSFSVAGLRGGLADERGNLALEYLKLAQRKRPRWLVWENVPGVLSTNGGRGFGAFLGGLVELGYGFAYRVLDAQYFGVPQRRNRVFVVGYFGDWRPAAAVLFERHSLQGHSAPSREPGQGTAAEVAPSLTASGRGVERTGESRGQDPVVAHALVACNSVTGSLTARGDRNGGQSNDGVDGNKLIVMASGRANAELSPALNCNRDGAPIAFGWQNSPSQSDSVSDSVTPTLDKSKVPAVAFDTTQITSKENRSNPRPGDPCHPLAAGAHPPAIAGEMSVRRLTPTECERLQGFPDGYTAIPWRNKPAAQCPDGPRYKALGNSMAVPVMHWIGRRIGQVERILMQEKEKRPQSGETGAANG